MIAEDKTEQSGKREDYTDLSLVYQIKIFSLLVVVLVGIVITLYDFKSLLITAFTFFIGVVFDFIVILLKNTGPKIRVRIIITKLALGIVLLGILVSFIGIIYLLQFKEMDTEYMEAIMFYLRMSMLCGVVSPYLELKINKAPDD